MVIYHSHPYPTVSKLESPGTANEIENAIKNQYIGLAVTIVCVALAESGPPCRRSQAKLTGDGGLLAEQVQYSN